jgi:hypothetical protein
MLEIVLETYIYMKNQYSSKDLSIASLFYAKKIPFLGIDRAGNVCWFNFEQKELCEKLQQQFYSKSIDVNAKDYSDAMRTLKNLLYSAS